MAPAVSCLIVLLLGALIVATLRVVADDTVCAIVYSYHLRRADSSRLGRLFLRMVACYYVASVGG